MNRCFFTGRLTKDAELVITTSGYSIMKFGLAVNNGYGKNKTTLFLNCFKFVKEKEHDMIPKLVKGKPLTIIAEYNINKWIDDNKVEKERPEFKIIEYEFVLNDPTFKKSSDVGEEIPF